MATAYIAGGRKPANDDFQNEPVWIKHAETGVIHKVFHKYHINRLLMDGGQIVSAPAETPVPTPVESEETLKIKALEMQIARLLAEREAHASTSNDGGSDHTRTADDSRSGRGKSAIH